MFIKVTVKNSESKLVPVMVNTEYIRYFEPHQNNRSYIVLDDSHVIVAEESFSTMEVKLNKQRRFML